jgi:putative ABC transport system ATP-binding protein
MIMIMTRASESGKTTLLTLIAGLRSAQKVTLGVMGAHNLLDSLTVRENVQMSLRQYSNLPYK